MCVVVDIMLQIDDCSDYVLFDLNHPCQIFNYIVLRLSKYSGKRAVLLTNIYSNPFVEDLINNGYFDQLVKYDFSMIHAHSIDEIILYFDDRFDGDIVPVNYHDIITSADLINVFGVYLNHFNIHAVLMETVPNQLNRGIARSQWGSKICDFSEEYSVLQQQPDILGGNGTSFRLLRHKHSSSAIGDTDFYIDYGALIASISPEVRTKLLKVCKLDDLAGKTILFMNSVGVVADRTSYDNITSYYLYQMIIDWILGDAVILKKHPNDSNDISSYFRGLQTMDTVAPIDFLNLETNNQHIRACSIASSSIDNIRCHVDTSFFFGNELLSSVSTYLPHLNIILRLVSRVFNSPVSIYQNIVNMKNENKFLRWMAEVSGSSNIVVSDSVEGGHISILRGESFIPETNNVYFLLDHAYSCWFDSTIVPEDMDVYAIHIVLNKDQDGFVGVELNEYIYALVPQGFSHLFQNYHDDYINKCALSRIKVDCTRLYHNNNSLKEVLVFNNCPRTFIESYKRDRLNHYSCSWFNRLFVYYDSAPEDIQKKIVDILENYDLDNISTLYNDACNSEKDADYISCLLYISALNGHARAAVKLVNSDSCDGNFTIVNAVDTGIIKLLLESNLRGSKEGVYRVITQRLDQKKHIS